MEKNKKLNSKDFINIGIFTAIYIVVGIAIAMVLGFIPIAFVLLSLINPLICGIPMMLYYSKIKKPGMILTLAVINGLIMIVTGMGYYALILGVITAGIAELILKSGDYSSAKKSVISYGFFSLNIVGCYIPWYFASEAWLESTRATYGDTYTNTISGLLSHWWILPALACACFIGGVLGGLLGRKMFKKHFERSGII